MVHVLRVRRLQSTPCVCTVHPFRPTGSVGLGSTMKKPLSTSLDYVRLGKQWSPKVSSFSPTLDGKALWISTFRLTHGARIPNRQLSPLLTLFYQLGPTVTSLSPFGNRLHPFPSIRHAAMTISLTLASQALSHCATAFRPSSGSHATYRCCTTRSSSCLHLACAPVLARVVPLMPLHRAHHRHQVSSSRGHRHRFLQLW